MTKNNPIGSVSAIWIFPVKSMQGYQIEQGEFTERGLVGDRAYALIDQETGKVISAKSVRLFPELFQCHAKFIDTPQAEGQLPPVQITLANGKTVTSDAKDIDQVLSGFFGRSVTLAQAAPDDFTIDQYHPDIEGAAPHGQRDTVAEQKLGSAFFAEAGIPSPVAAGSFLDLFPVSVLTSSTLQKLGQLQPDSIFDECRFRMNIIIDTKNTGFVENSWVGQALALGDSLRLQVAMPDPRCVMTTLAQGELLRDNEVLRTLVQHNRIQVGDSGQFPCAGVYVVVQTPGLLQTGDKVVVG